MCSRRSCICLKLPQMSVVISVGKLSRNGNEGFSVYGLTTIVLMDVDVLREPDVDDLWVLDFLLFFVGIGSKSSFEKSLESFTGRLRLRSRDDERVLYSVDIASTSRISIEGV